MFPTLEQVVAHWPLTTFHGTRWCEAPATICSSEPEPVINSAVINIQQEMFYKWTDIHRYYKWFANIWTRLTVAVFALNIHWWSEYCGVIQSSELAINIWSWPGLPDVILTAGPSPDTGGVSGREWNTWWSALCHRLYQGNYPVFPENESRKLLRCYHYHSPVVTLMLLHLARRLVTTLWHSADHHLRWGEGQLPIFWAPLMTCHQKNAHSIGSIWAKLAKWSPINFVFQRMSLFVVSLKC